MHLMVWSWSCPGFFFLGFFLILLCPKQSGFKSPGISEQPMIPHFGQYLISQWSLWNLQGHFWNMAPSDWIAQCQLLFPCFRQSAQRTSQHADNALRTDKIHCYDLTQNCLSVMRKEAILGVSVVVIVRVARTLLPLPWHWQWTGTFHGGKHHHCFHLQ